MTIETILGAVGIVIFLLWIIVRLVGVWRWEDARREAGSATITDRGQLDLPARRGDPE